MTEFNVGELVYNLSMCCVPRHRRVVAVKERLGALALEKKHELHLLSQRIVEVRRKYLRSAAAISANRRFCDSPRRRAKKKTRAWMSKIGPARSPRSASSRG